MNCSRAGWTYDHHFSPFASQRKEVGGISESVLTEIQKFMKGGPGQHLILGGDFKCELARIDRDTNDSLRARALHTVVAELDLTVTNTWMDADSEQELFTRSSWSDPAEALTQMDFTMSSKKLENETRARAGLRLVQSGVCCSFTDNENEVYDEEQARRFLRKSGCRDVDRLEKLECDGGLCCWTRRACSASGCGLKLSKSTQGSMLQVKGSLFFSVLSLSHHNL